MIVYWLLALPTAVIAYYCGSVSTLVLAGNYIFHKNLRKLGRGNAFLSNFKRVYGIKGAVYLLLTEAVKDIVPILIGSLIFMLKGHGDVGRAFAGFCIVMGRLWPFNNLRGSHATMTLIFAALMTETSVGLAAAFMVIVFLLWTKYISLATIMGALGVLMFTILVVDDKLIMILMILTATAVLIKHIPSIKRLIKGKEQKYSFETDLLYKLDEKF